MASQILSYNRNIPIGEQLKFHRNHEPVTLTRPDGTEIHYTKSSFLPLDTRAGPITISFKGETQTKFNRGGNPSIFSIYEFEIVTTRGVYKAPAPAAFPGTYQFEPLDKMVKEIDAFAAQEFQKPRNSSRCPLM